VTVTSNGSPYATGPLCCLSITLVYCGQTVEWMKMPLGAEVGLGPGDNVMGTHKAAPHGKKRSSPPLFGPCRFGPRLLSRNGRPSQLLLSSCQGYIYYYAIWHHSIQCKDVCRCWCDKIIYKSERRLKKSKIFELDPQLRYDHVLEDIIQNRA